MKNLEFRANPHRELESNVFVSICAAITPGFGNYANSVGLLCPFFSAEAEIVEPRLAFNYVEFGRIKLGIENLLPSPQKLNGVPVSQPIMEEKLSVLGTHHIRETDIVLTSDLNHCYGDATYIYLCHSTISIIVNSVFLSSLLVHLRFFRGL